MPSPTSGYGSEERRWTLWICDKPSCNNWAEQELGEICEVCEEGKITEIEVVPAAERDSLQERLEEVERDAVQREQTIAGWIKQRDDAITGRLRAERERDSLASEVERLREALEPFARFADALNGEWDEDDGTDDLVGEPVWADEETVSTELVTTIPEPTVSAYRNARSALSDTNQPDD